MSLLAAGRGRDGPLPGQSAARIPACSLTRQGAGPGRAPALALAGAASAGACLSGRDPLAAAAGAMGALLLGRAPRASCSLRTTACAPAHSGRGLGSVHPARLLPHRWRPISPPRVARRHRNLAFWPLPASVPLPVVSAAPPRALLCDLWQPPPTVAPSGLGIIYCHAGGWQNFDKDTGTRPFFSLLAALGHVVMDVEDRLVRRDRSLRHARRRQTRRWPGCERTARPARAAGPDRAGRRLGRRATGAAGRGTRRTTRSLIRPTWPALTRASARFRPTMARPTCCATAQGRSIASGRLSSAGAAGLASSPGHDPTWPDVERRPFLARPWPMSPGSRPALADQPRHAGLPADAA